MQAQARAILTQAVTNTQEPTPTPPKVPGGGKSVCNTVRGTLKSDMTTDQFMKLTRGN